MTCLVRGQLFIQSLSNPLVEITIDLARRIHLFRWVSAPVIVLLQIHDTVFHIEGVY